MSAYDFRADLYLLRSITLLSDIYCWTFATNLIEVKVLYWFNNLTVNDLNLNGGFLYPGYLYELTKQKL